MATVLSTSVWSSVCALLCTDFSDSQQDVPAPALPRTCAQAPSAPPGSRSGAVRDSCSSAAPGGRDWGGPAHAAAVLGVSPTSGAHSAPASASGSGQPSPHVAGAGLGGRSWTCAPGGREYHPRETGGPRTLCLQAWAWPARTGRGQVRQRTGGWAACSPGAGRMPWTSLWELQVHGRLWAPSCPGLGPSLALSLAFSPCAHRPQLQIWQGAQARPVVRRQRAAWAVAPGS